MALTFTKNSPRFILRGIFFLLAIQGSSVQAQLVLTTDPIKINLEGYLNASVGHSENAKHTNQGATRTTQAEGGLRVYAEHSLAPQQVIGVRVEVNASPQDHLNVGERSLLYIDSFGRFEIGRRRGLPDSLIGYAPNTYAFTSAEFGVTSGRTLDPGARLVTSFLPANLARRIDTISENGANGAFFGDTSPKALYVSPKVWGSQLGLSYAPKIENGARIDNPYKELFQAGLAYQEDFGQDFFRLGGSFSYANLDEKTVRLFSTIPTKDLASLSIGAALNLGEVWEFGINVSQNSDDKSSSPGSPRHGAHGITASINYNDGEWVYGGYVQRAIGGQNVLGSDRLSALQLGLAYRLDTKLRVFCALYLYQLDNKSNAGQNQLLKEHGKVFLAGVRWTL